MSGSAIGQVLTLAAAPVLTRLYEPEELGVLAVFASILAIGTVAICLRYEVAIPLPDDDSTARDLAWLCLVIATVASAAVGVAALALAEPLSQIGAMQDAAPLLVLLAPSLFGIGVIQVLTYWSLRRQRFPLIGAANATQAGAQAGAQVGMGAADLGAAGLLVGLALGRLRAPRCWLPACGGTRASEAGRRFAGCMRWGVRTGGSQPSRFGRR